jgi:hypothetical protein
MATIASAFVVSGFTLAVIWASILGTVREGWSFPGTLVAAFCVCLAAVMWRMVFIRLTVDDGGVTIVNVLSARHVPWESIREFEVGWAYWGISLVLGSGRRVLVNAIQKPNVGHVSHRATRADEIVDELNELLEAGRSSPDG